MPAGGALFGSAAAGPGSTGGNKHLIEVRAGKMTLKGRMVYPDTRKGLLYVYQSDDSLMHFCWQDRTTGIVEDDLIIFPDDCEYVKIPQCTTGRAYLLKFKSSNKKFFFWLQEPKSDKDEDNCKRINELLNNPSSAVQNTPNPDQDLQSLLNNMSQSQLMQLFGSGVGQMGGLSSLLGTISYPSFKRTISSIEETTAATNSMLPTMEETAAATVDTLSVIPSPVSPMELDQSADEIAPLPSLPVVICDSEDDFEPQEPKKGIRVLNNFRVPTLPVSVKGKKLRKGKLVGTTGNAPCRSKTTRPQAVVPKSKKPRAAKKPRTASVQKLKAVASTSATSTSTAAPILIPSKDVKEDSMMRDISSVTAIMLKLQMRLKSDRGLTKIETESTYKLLKMLDDLEKEMEDMEEDMEEDIEEDIEENMEVTLAPLQEEAEGLDDELAHIQRQIDDLRSRQKVVHQNQKDVDIKIAKVKQSYPELEKKKKELEIAEIRFREASERMRATTAEYEQFLGNLFSLQDRGPNSGSARTNTTPAITHRTASTTVPSTPTTTAPSTQPTVTAGSTTPQNSAIPTVTPDAPRPKGRNSTRAPESPSFEPIQLADLQNFLTGITPPSGTAGAAAQQQSVDLSTALTSESLAGVLNDPETLQQLQNHLPAVDSNTQEALRSTLASPQFQQAVSQFSSALESGQLGPIVSQLSVNPDAVAAAAQGNMADFVKALEKSSSEASADKDKDKEAGQKKEDKKDDDDQMQLD